MSKIDWQREYAIAAGKPTYTRLKVCKFKHISDSYTATGQCIQCVTGLVNGESPRPISRKQAYLHGDLRYYEHKPCRNGHISERYTKSGACVECSREASNGVRRRL